LAGRIPRAASGAAKAWRCGVRQGKAGMWACGQAAGRAKRDAEQALPRVHHHPPRQSRCQGRLRLQVCEVLPPKQLAPTAQPPRAALGRTEKYSISPMRMGELPFRPETLVQKRESEAPPDPPLPAPRPAAA
jgi:hypothetical protein